MMLGRRRSSSATTATTTTTTTGGDHVAVDASSSSSTTSCGTTATGAARPERPTTTAGKGRRFSGGSLGLGGIGRQRSWGSFGIGGQKNKLAAQLNAAFMAPAAATTAATGAGMGGAGTIGTGLGAATSHVRRVPVHKSRSVENLRGASATTTAQESVDDPSCRSSMVLQQSSLTGTLCSQKNKSSWRESADVDSVDAISTSLDLTCANASETDSAMHPTLERVKQELAQPHRLSINLPQTDGSLLELVLQPSFGAAPAAEPVIIDGGHQHNNQDPRPLMVPSLNRSLRRFSGFSANTLRKAASIFSNDSWSIKLSSDDTDDPAILRSVTSFSCGLDIAIFDVADSPQNIQLEEQVDLMTGLTRMAVVAGTVEKLVDFLTKTLDNTYMIEFFLSYRYFLSPMQLLKLLSLRLKWAIQENVSDDRLVVRIRTFVVLRHWVTHFWMEDFLPSRTAQFSLASLIKTVLVPFVNTSPLATKTDVRIVSALKVLIKERIRATKHLLPAETPSKPVHRISPELRSPQSGNKPLPTPPTLSPQRASTPNPTQKKTQSSPHPSSDSNEANLDLVSARNHSNKRHVKLVDQLRIETATIEPALGSGNSKSPPGSAPVSSKAMKHRSSFASLSTMRNSIISQDNEPIMVPPSPSNRKSYNEDKLDWIHRVTSSLSSIRRRLPTKFSNLDDEHSAPPTPIDDIETESQVPATPHHRSWQPPSRAEANTATSSLQPAENRRKSISFKIGRSASLSNLLSSKSASSTSVFTSPSSGDVPPVPKLPPGTVSPYHSFVLNHPPGVVAAQFALIEQAALRSVKWTELLDVSSWAEATVISAGSKTSSSETEERGRKRDSAWAASPRVDESGVQGLIDRFNQTCQWVVSEVVSTGKMETRVKVIEAFIQIAKECLAQCNYSTLMQITLALQNPSIERLRRTWAFVSPLEKAALSSLQSMLTPFGNFKLLRAAMSQVADACGNEPWAATSQSGGGGPSGPQQAFTGAVPFTGLYLSDLVALSHLPVHVDSAASTEAARVINFRRMRTLATTIRRFRAFQSAPALTYHHEPDPACFHLATYLRTLDDAEIRERSLMLEPKT